MAEEKSLEREVGEMSVNVSNLCNDVTEIKSLLKDLHKGRIYDIKEKEGMKTQIGKQGAALKILYIFIPIIASATVLTVIQIVKEGVA